MSNLISSFIIDPVVRQARRFSGAVPPSEESSRSASHANPIASPPLSSPLSSHAHLVQDVNAGNEQDPAAVTAVSQPATLLDHFRQNSAQSPVAIDDGDEDNDDEQEEESRNVVDGDDGTAYAPRLNPSRDGAYPPAPSPSIDTHANANMSPTPSRSLGTEFQRLDLARSPPVDIPAPVPPQNQSSTIPIASPQDASTTMPESLPADDGMRHLRARIHDIRNLTIGEADKARMMHSIMTERYNFLRPQSPNSFVSNDRPFTPTSGQSIFSDVHLSSPISQASDIDPDNPFNLRPGDTDPTYRLCDRDQSADNIGDEEDLDTPEDGPSLGCQHYKRNVKVQCFHCRRWYTCRNCHDAVEDHNLDRSKTQNMLCMACGTAQKAGEHCTQCGMIAAWYYCDICKLWDDDSSKKIYHCMDCGICRKGEGLGKDYFHCKRCNVCIAISHASTHKCLERATDCDCPICGEYLFNSSSAVVAMPCGHYLHKGCYKLYMETAYKCPMCKKSAVNMELQWRKLTQAIESQPMPEQFANTRAIIQCNDCSAKSSVSYHWLGNKCNTCDSYNTNEFRILNGPQSEEAANAFLAAEAESGVRFPGSASSPSSQPLQSPRYYFQPDKPEETWLPGQLPSFPFQMPQFPGMPQMPQMPQIPQFPGMPQIPQFPGMPQIPQFPGMPQLPPFPQMPQMPDPYELFERVSRSFPQIRNYLNPTGEVPDENVPIVDLGEERPECKATDGSTVQQPSLPQYVLERFSKSFSPFRNYWTPSMEIIPRLDLSEGQDLDELRFWGEDGGRVNRFLSGREEGDEDSSSDESLNDEDEEDDDEDDEEDEADGEGDDREFDLPGHP